MLALALVEPLEQARSSFGADGGQRVLAELAQALAFVVRLAAAVKVCTDDVEPPRIRLALELDAHAAVVALAIEADKVNPGRLEISILPEDCAPVIVRVRVALPPILPRIGGRLGRERDSALVEVLEVLGRVAVLVLEGPVRGRRLVEVGADVAQPAHVFLHRGHVVELLQRDDAGIISQDDLLHLEPAPLPVDDHSQVVLLHLVLAEPVVQLLQLRRVSLCRRHLLGHVHGFGRTHVLHEEPIVGKAVGEDVPLEHSDRVNRGRRRSARVVVAEELLFDVQLEAVLPVHLAQR
mmetsp:Transcript_21968/g.52696  ORF Transcript_21968/g.52696 Transcript_21968/m.52696 type:complete len:294 (+) Transcript_21968:1785-2666(+)